MVHLKYSFNTKECSKGITKKYFKMKRLFKNHNDLYKCNHYNNYIKCEPIQIKKAEVIKLHMNQILLYAVYERATVDSKLQTACK